MTAGSVPLKPARGRRTWSVAGCEFTRTPGVRGPWGCSRPLSGVDGYRTPVGAFLALRRWTRQA